jgi:hypothetical protein
MALLLRPPEHDLSAEEVQTHRLYLLPAISVRGVPEESHDFPGVITHTVVSDLQIVPFTIGTTSLLDAVMSTSSISCYSDMSMSLVSTSRKSLASWIITLRAMPGNKPLLAVTSQLFLKQKNVKCSSMQ